MTLADAVDLDKVEGLTGGGAEGLLEDFPKVSVDMTIFVEV